MKCMYCNTYNDDRYKFCVKCGRSLTNQPQPLYAEWPEIQKKKYKISDIATIGGFAMSIMGVFMLWLIFNPLSLALSIFGFAKDNKRALAVAGIIISVISILFHIGKAIYAYMPYWAL